MSKNARLSFVAALVATTCFTNLSNACDLTSPQRDVSTSGTSPKDSSKSSSPNSMDSVDQLNAANPHVLSKRPHFIRRGFLGSGVCRLIDDALTS